MTPQVRKVRHGIGQCQDCGISPQLTDENGRCYECAERYPQLQMNITARRLK